MNFTKAIAITTTLLITFLFSSAVTASLPYKELSFSNMIVFGDSLSDAGNPNPIPEEKRDVGNNYWAKISGFSPDQKTLQMGAPITSTNDTYHSHLMWPNYLIKRLFNQNQLFPSSQARILKLDPTKYNVDYAWASAETNKHYLNDNTNSSYPPYNDANCITHGPGYISKENVCVPGTEKQVQLYLHDLKTYKEAAPKNTLYIIWAGGNDIFNDIKKIVSGNKQQLFDLQTWQTLKQALEQNTRKTKNLSSFNNLSFPVENLVKTKDELLKAGVSPQQIYVLGLPDLSKVPAAVAIAKGNKALLAIFKLISAIFNVNLKTSLCLNTAKGEINLPLSHVVPVAKLFELIEKNPRKHHDIANVSSTAICLPTAWPDCKTRGGYYLWFNSKHPTTQGHWSASDYLYKIITQR